MRFTSLWTKALIILIVQTCQELLAASSPMIAENPMLLQILNIQQYERPHVNYPKKKPNTLLKTWRRRQLAMKNPKI